MLSTTPEVIGNRRWRGQGRPLLHLLCGLKEYYITRSRSSINRIGSYCAQIIWDPQTRNGGWVGAWFIPYLRLYDLPWFNLDTLTFTSPCIPRGTWLRIYCSHLTKNLNSTQIPFELQPWVMSFAHTNETILKSFTTRNSLASKLLVIHMFSAPSQAAPIWPTLRNLNANMLKTHNIVELEGSIPTAGKRSVAKACVYLLQANSSLKWIVGVIHCSDARTYSLKLNH
jgi:hypothetical protein